MLAEPFAACLPVVKLLREIGSAHYIGGSFASSFHGTPRLTNDVDLVVELNLAQAALLIADLDGRYYIDQARVLEAVKKRSSFNILFLKTMFKIDIFVSGDTLLDRSAMRRRQRISLGDDEVDIASPEDSILRKLDWYRSGNEVSERQWRDVLGILKTQGSKLDILYLEEMVDALSLRDHWQRARDAA
jgi:hypothetical protein